MRILSFGGGVQTTALLLMVIKGEVKTDHVVFADTGGELPGTYRWVDDLENRAKEANIPFTRVECPEGPLYDYVWNRSAAIPVRVGNNEGLGHRQCTRQWKITPVLTHARSLTDERPIIMQLGISYDEIHRMKNSPDKDVIREWPLIDLKMTRQDCRAVIREHFGDVEPPKSACYFCPMLPASYFRRLASESPEIFEKAVALEDRINVKWREGKKPAYLTPTGKPLSEFDTGQMNFFTDEFGGECEGSCFV
jgi:hypothetical protein